MNPYIPKDCPYEILGYFEEFTDAHTFKGLGCRVIKEPMRPLGSGGLSTYQLTESVVLTKGLKEVTIKASPKRPRLVRSMIQILCGRIKNVK